MVHHTNNIGIGWYALIGINFLFACQVNNIANLMLAIIFLFVKIVIINSKLGIK